MVLFVVNGLGLRVIHNPAQPAIPSVGTPDGATGAVAPP